MATAVVVDREAQVELVREALGRAVAVEFKVGDAATMPAAPQPPPAAAAPAAAAAPKSGPKDKRDWHKHPAVNNVLEAFNGDISDVR